MTDKAPFDSFDEEDWEDLFQSDNPDFVLLSGGVVEDQRRWVTTYSQVVQERNTDHYYRIYWEQGNTEYQETEPNYRWERVEPYQLTVTKYRRIT